MRDRSGLDIIADMRSRLLRLVLATAAVCTATACQTPNPEGAKKEVVDANAKAPDAKDVKTTDPAPAPATTATAGAAATADTAPTAGTATAPGTAGEPSTLDPGGEPTPKSDAGVATPPAADPAAPAVDKAKVLAEVKAKKTSDARAKKALEEAEAAGATVRELAEASNARGVALLGAGEAERATAAFEWARDKDTTYPDPSFNLAKQTANAGEVPETVKHLKEVSKRGGKALLKQASFDPTFEIVKDDPELKSILK
jgi:hypothetical protein